MNCSFAGLWVHHPIMGGPRSDMPKLVPWTHIPPNEKARKSSTQKQCLFKPFKGWGYVSSQDG